MVQYPHGLMHSTEKKKTTKNKNATGFLVIVAQWKQPVGAIITAEGGTMVHGYVQSVQFRGHTLGSKTVFYIYISFENPVLSLTSFMILGRSLDLSGLGFLICKVKILYLVSSAVPSSSDFCISEVGNNLLCSTDSSSPCKGLPWLSSRSTTSTELLKHFSPLLELRPFLESLRKAYSKSILGKGLGDCCVSSNPGPTPYSVTSLRHLYFSLPTYKMVMKVEPTWQA